MQAMDGEYREALVLVGDHDFEIVIEELHALATVTQVLPPRLALVLLPAAPPDIPGTAWYVEDVPTDVYRDLTPEERLFVDGWRARRHPKPRPDDHLPWDAPDHEPPDGPTR
ncbi:hypothetical protein [Streptomyces sp. URMC 129]|uniref:hypothetical protein n=1 Tax=Streptomyces sp. URMC 129 TaxID=3423407 RepID=UPI003F1DD965